MGEFCMVAFVKNIYFFAGRSSDAVQTAEKLLKLANDTGQVDHFDSVGVLFYKGSVASSR